jgi:hypothetical protein
MAPASGLASPAGCCRSDRQHQIPRGRIAGRRLRAPSPLDLPAGARIEEASIRTGERKHT